MKPTYRHLLTFALSASLSATLLAACEKPETKDPDDMGDGDLATSGRKDLAMSPDLAKSPADLATPPADLATAGPKLTGLPVCTITGVTAETVYKDVIATSCSGGGRCHASGAGKLTITSGPTLIANNVGVAADQTTVMPRVKAGNIDQSYLLYKLMDQQMMAGGSGGLMPKNGTKLPDAELCKFIVWVKEGAK